MTLNLRWVGDEQRDRVAETRMLCYAPARKELTDYVQRLREDARSGPGDWLLAETPAGEAVGTATSYPMTMWVRGARERGFVVSALMPFRGSFYEHFGYGFVERRADWTIPMTVLPPRENDE